MSPFKVILFDLGGVLVELTGVPTMHQWSNHRYDDDELWSYWLRSDAVRSFETGKISASRFADQIIEEMALPINKKEFLDKFTRWPKGLFPGASDLLTNLRKSFTLACLSNTNELHWPRLMHEMGLHDLLDHHYSSHKLGMLKPDLDVFQHVVDELACKPAAILFLDDNIINVRSAQKVGMEAYCVKGMGEVTEQLTALDLAAHPRSS